MQNCTLYAILCEINYFFSITDALFPIFSIIFAFMSKKLINTSTKELPKEIVSLLDSEAQRINTPQFISSDPVQFPRRFSRQEDIEIAALLVATISWGRRTMICRDAERLLERMDQSPYNFMMEEAYEMLNPKENVHRTFFCRDLQYYLRGLRAIYSRYANLDAFCAAHHVGDSEAPCWEFARLLALELAEANAGKSNSQCVPGNLKNTPLKRLNMALRWLVRNDGIVDMGIWRSISPAQLYIPLDVHSGNTSRELGLITRNANDRKALEELMTNLRPLRPEDPAIYDYALFGIGIGI